MLREHSVNEIKENNYKSLLPQIAQLLDVSVAKLESYPADMQMFLCQTYINNYNLTDEAARQALCNVINLEQSECKHIVEQSDPEPTEKVSQEEKQNSLISCDAKAQEDKTFFISRKQILENAKLLSENKQSNQYERQSEEFTRNNYNN